MKITSLNWRQRFLSSPLLLKLLLLAGPLLALQWLTVVRALDRAIELDTAVFSQRGQTTGQLVAQILSGQLRAFDHLLLGLRKDLDDGAPARKVAATKPNPLYGLTGLQVHLIDPQGRLAFPTLNGLPISTDLTDSTAYQTLVAERRDRLVVTKPTHYYPDGPWLIYFTRPRLVGADSQFNGTVSISLPAQTFCGLFESVDFDEDAVLGLTLHDGSVLTRCVSKRFSGGVRMVPADLSETGTFKVNGAIDDAGVRRSPIDGINRMVSIRSLSQFPLYVYYGTPLQPLDASNWDLRLRYGLGGTVVSVLLALTLYGLLLALHTREASTRAMARQVEALERSQVELEASRNSLQALSAHQVSVREEEGRRIAREIHDELGQRLTVLRMDLTFLGKGLPPGEATQQVGVIKDRIDDILAIARDISRKLRPAGLDLGLSTAVDALVSELSESLTVSLELRDELPPRLKLPEPLAAAAFRIIQEGVTNAIRHAHSANVLVHMALRHDTLELTVKDDGQGLPTTTNPACPSFGLSGMRERAHAVGGTLDIASASDKGVSVVARLPLTLDAPLPTPRSAPALMPAP